MTWACHTVTTVDTDNCYKHIQWAETQGRAEHPEWYPEGTTFDNADTQCALYLKTNGKFDGDSHGCDLPPCNGISESMLKSTDADVSKCIKPVAAAPLTEAPPAGPSVEWWGWLLIVAAILGVGALIAFALGLFGAAKPKKKRAVKTIAPEPEPAPVMTYVSAVPTYEVAPPVYTYSAAAPIYEATQSIAVAAPQVVTAPPVYTTGSVVQPTAMPMSVVQPMSYSTVQAAPVISTISAAPMVSTYNPYAGSPQLVMQS